jgi:hypothetical protein
MTAAIRRCGGPPLVSPTPRRIEFVAEVGFQAVPFIPPVLRVAMLIFITPAVLFFLDVPVLRLLASSPVFAVLTVTVAAVHGGRDAAEKVERRSGAADISWSGRKP